MSRIVSLECPSDVSNGPVCGITATSIITGKSFKEVREVYRSFQEDDWKGTLDNADILDVLENHYELEVTDITGNIAGYPLKKVIVPLALKNPETMLLIFTTDHVQVVVDRYVCDQYGLYMIKEYWAKSLPIISVYKIEGVTPKIPLHKVKHRVKREDSIYQKILKTMEPSRWNDKPSNTIKWMSENWDIKYPVATVYYYRMKKERS